MGAGVGVGVGVGVGILGNYIPTPTSPSALILVPPTPVRVKEFPRSFASAALPVQSLRDSAAATPVGGPAWRRRFRTFSFRLREMMSGMTSVF